MSELFGAPSGYLMWNISTYADSTEVNDIRLLECFILVDLMYSYL